MSSVKEIHPVRVVIEHDDKLKHYQVSIMYVEDSTNKKHTDKNEFTRFIDALITAMNFAYGHRIELECLI